MFTRSLPTILFLNLVLMTSAAHAHQCKFEGAIGGGNDSAKVFSTGDGVVSFVADLDVNTDGALSSYSITDLGHKNASGRLDTNNALNVICNGASIRKPNGDPLYGSGQCYSLIREFKRIRDVGWLTPGENFVHFFGIEVSKKTYVTRPNGKPILRGVPCESGGYYVSQVAKSLPGGTYGDCKPEKWLDALAIPAIVVPRTGIMAEQGVKQHDLAIVRLTSNGKWVGAIVGDTNDSKVGEATVNVAARITGSSLPKTYRETVSLALGSGAAEYIVFPGTASLISDLSNSSDGDIQQAAKGLYEKHNIGSHLPLCKWAYPLSREPEQQTEELNHPNAMLALDDALYVGGVAIDLTDMGPGKFGRILQIDYATQDYKRVPGSNGLATWDGLVPFNGGFLGSSPATGELWYVKDGEATVVANLGPSISDFGWDAENQIMFVPHLNEGKVLAY